MVGAAARRYARAIFDLAQAEDRVEEWAGRLQTVRELLSMPEVREVLANPSLASTRRQELAVSLLDEARVGREGVNLARLLIEANRLSALDGIVEEYGRLADEASGRVRVTATTAVPLTREDMDRLVDDLSRRLGKEVRLEVRVDPAILGGLVLQIGDRVLDASVAARLQQLRRRLGGT
ncbi:MAG TPA: F0F1 ATP synthase subunit delta [Candidatus Dormibacteraeota bacterium]|jgi:F-type H+-transporting ATPase subunit delta|nr:F0F1 ATP synthase subunit delta [Candidatus Dormibacteraeota bacterium]